MTSVGAVVVHHASPDTLQETLRSLAAQSFPVSTVVVADDFSEVPDLDVAVVRTPSNQGYGAAANLGIAWLREHGAPDHVLVLTHEVLLDPECLARLVASADGAGAVGPLLGLRSAPGTVWSAGCVRSPRKRVVVHRGTGESVTDWATRPVEDVEWCDGAALLLSSAALAQVGGFEEAFFLYYEESDLQLRMGAAGWPVRVVPGAMAWQEPGMTPPYLAARNRVLLARRLRSPWEVLAALRTNGQELRAAPSLVLRGTVDGLTGRLDRSRALVRPR